MVSQHLKMTLSERNNSVQVHMRVCVNVSVCVYVCVCVCVCVCVSTCEYPCTQDFSFLNEQLLVCTGRMRRPGQFYDVQELPGNYTVSILTHTT